MTEIKTYLKFQKRPSPVFAEHRPLYKICQIILVLYIASRSNRSQFARLHLFNWALKSPQRSEQLIKAAENKILHIPAWGFDPVLPIAIRFAIAEGLIKEIKGAYELSASGRRLAEYLNEDISIFVTEKAVLQKIGKGITETMVNNIAKEWEIT